MSTNPKASQKQRAASDPHVTAWVNANAGSGKTHVLVDRVVRLMLDGVEPSRIMCLTFTKAAAAEMANRLFDRLSAWITLDDEALVDQLTALGQTAPDGASLERARQLFTRALETPGGLKIQTIHAFCERVLQLFPVEAGIVPHFAMLDDRAAGEMLEAARDKVLLAAQDGSEAELAAALSDVASRAQSDQFSKLLSQLLAMRADLGTVFVPEQGLLRANAALRSTFELGEHEQQADVRATLRIDRGEYERLAGALESGSKTDIERASLIRTILQDPAATLEDFETFYLTKGRKERKSPGGTKAVQDRNQWIADFAAAEQFRLMRGLGRLADLERVSATLSLLRLGSAIVMEFTEAKRRQGAYDFNDLIIRTAELLQERPDAAWVLYKLDGGIEHLLVDEAQDTSPAQWDIIRSLTDEFFAGQGKFQPRPRTLFVVGDRKQSIFSFQGADPDVFEDVHGDFKQRTEDAGQAFCDVDFTVSFRTVPEILTAVDEVFEPGSDVRKGLDGRTGADWVHESNRSPQRGVVELWPLVEPLDAESDDPWQAPVDRAPQSAPHRRLARHLAQTIKQWIGRRVIVALDRVVRPGDILILVRRRNAFFDALIRALWAEGVPVAGADRLKLGDNLAVMDLLALAQVALMPEDDYALACVLKSPVLSKPLDEEDLFQLAWNRGPASLWQRLKESGAEKDVAAAELLSALIDSTGTARPYEFFAGALATCRRRFLERLGSEANDAIDAFLDLALTYEENHATSLAGFVNWFVAGEVEIKRNMEQGSGEVRIMTVHGAKGLEAPVVILPDTVSAPDHRTEDPLLMVPLGNGNARVALWSVPKLMSSENLDRRKVTRSVASMAEYQRLLYVAMTRARDELYICGYHGQRAPKPECWYEIVKAGMTGLLDGVSDGSGIQRYGLAPVYRDEVPAQRVETGELPDWVMKPFGKPAAGNPVPVAKAAERPAAAVARGTLIHRILQQICEIDAGARPAFISQAVTRAGYGNELADQLTSLIQHDAFAEVFTPEGVSEVPVILASPDGGQERRRIDRLVFTDHDLLLIDYKTDRIWPRAPDDANPAYLEQLARYRDAMRQIYGSIPMRLALLWTEAPLLMVIPDDVLDRAAGQHSVNHS